MWDLWIPNAGSTGVSFARAVVAGDAAAAGVLVHAAPPLLEATVRAAGQATVLAHAQLQRSAEGPMVLLVRDGDQVRLEDRWPAQDDLGRIVLLPGGEAGVLTAWEHADDQSW